MDDLTIWAIITALIIPLLAIVFPWLEHRRNLYHSTLEFLSQGNTDAEKDRRKTVYKRFEKAHQLSIEDITELDADGDLGRIISFYDGWANMVKKNYLPLKTFKGINGVTVIRLFFILRPYILKRRNNDPTIIINDNTKILVPTSLYAADFEYLVKRIIKRNLISLDSITKEQLIQLLNH